MKLDYKAARMIEKEKQLVKRYRWALYHAACAYSRTKTDCNKCECKNSCKRNPATIGCRFALENKWKRDAGIEDNQGTDDAPTYPQEQFADSKAVDKAVNHPSYYKTGGIEAIDVIEAWNLDFCLGNTVKYIARCGKKSDKVVEDLKKAAWYLNREIESREHK